MLLLFYLSVLSITGLVYGLPEGPPLSTCENLTPDPGSHGPNNNVGENGGFLIATDIPYNQTERLYTYEAEQNYTVQIQNQNGATFRGFMVQAIDPSDTGIGTFMADSASNQQILQCPMANQPTIAHMNMDRLDFSVQTFMWIAPSDSDGLVDFMYTVVQRQPEYFVALRAGEQPQISLSSDAPPPQANDRTMFIRAHGIFMIIAWPLLAVTAIFFAAWMRPALPNGEWFQVHRAVMLGSLFIGAVGFLLIFVGSRDNPTPGLITLGGTNRANTAHFALGIIIMFLHILNPIISIFRCHPGKPFRWVFNLIHGTIIGLIVEILALVNVGIGLSLFGTSFSRLTAMNTPFYVYLGFIGFLILLILILFIMFSVLSCTSDESDRVNLAPSLVKPLINSGNRKESTQQKGTELSVPGQKSSEPENKPKKLPSHDAPLRWTAFAIFAIVTIPLMVALVVLIAI